MLRATGMNADNCDELVRILGQLRRGLERETVLRLAKTEGYEFVLYDDGSAPVGAAGFRFLETIARGFHCHLHDLCVDQSARGRGIGRAIIAHLIEQTTQRGGRWLFLDGIESALPFYESCGFVRHQATLLKHPCAPHQFVSP